jgi:hypothetical protein
MSTINDEKIDLGKTETLVYSVEVQKAIDEVDFDNIIYTLIIPYCVQYLK